MPTSLLLCLDDMIISRGGLCTISFSSSSSKAVPLNGTIQLGYRPLTADSYLILGTSRYSVIPRITKPNDETRDTSTSTSDPQLSDSLSTLRSVIISDRVHHLHFSSDSLQLSVLDEHGKCLGTGSFDTKSSKKRRITVDINDQDQQIICKITIKFKWDDFDHEYHQSYQMVYIFKTICLLGQKFGWIIYLLLLAAIIIFTNISNNRRRMMTQLVNVSPNKLPFKPGMTLYQGDYVQFCKHPSDSNNFQYSCEQSFLHLSQDGVISAYQGTSPHDPNASLQWKMDIEIPLDASNKNKPKLFDGLKKIFQRNRNDKELTEQRFRVLRNYDDELVLYKGDKVKSLTCISSYDLILMSKCICNRFG